MELTINRKKFFFFLNGDNNKKCWHYFLVVSKLNSQTFIIGKLGDKKSQVDSFSIVWAVALSQVFILKRRVFHWRKSYLSLSIRKKKVLSIPKGKNTKDRFVSIEYNRN